MATPDRMIDRLSAQAADDGNFGDIPSIDRTAVAETPGPDYSGLTPDAFAVVATMLGAFSEADAATRQRAAPVVVREIGAALLSGGHTVAELDAFARSFRGTANMIANQAESAARRNRFQPRPEDE